MAQSFVVLTAVPKPKQSVSYFNNHIVRSTTFQIRTQKKKQKKQKTTAWFAFRVVYIKGCASGAKQCCNNEGQNLRLWGHRKTHDPVNGLQMQTRSQKQVTAAGQSSVSWHEIHQYATPAVELSARDKCDNFVSNSEMS